MQSSYFKHRKSLVSTAETLLKRLEDGLTKFEAMMDDVKSKEEDEIPSEYDQISRANWLLAVQSVIDEQEV